jgi:P pilus assembly chaperone PapD
MLNFLIYLIQYLKLSIMYPKTKKVPFKNLISLLIFMVFTASLFAQGDLLITPRRVVFEGNKRVEELNLSNTGRDTATYNVSFVQYRMTEDGSFQEITEPDPGQNFADKNLRFFPRSVTLAPGEAQTVRMQVINRERLAPGEYRSHVYFRAVPKEGALGMEDANADTAALSIRLIPIFGITIPIIIRTGENSTRVTLSDLALSQVNDTTKVLSITFNRTGNMSAYGDIRVTHIAPDGTNTPVGAVNGIAVYTPNTTRKFNYLLDKNIPVNLGSGTIKVEYYSQSDRNPEKLSEALLNLK